MQQALRHSTEVPKPFHKTDPAMPATEMLSTHPSPSTTDTGAVSECIEACFDCAQACTACADACLGEDQVQNLIRCIRLNLDCADICETTGRVLSRQTETDQVVVRSQIESLRQVVKACGDECERHAEMHEHCATCMEACRRCEESCDAVLSELQSGAPA